MKIGKKKNEGIKERSLLSRRRRRREDVGVDAVYDERQSLLENAVQGESGAESFRSFRLAFVGFFGFALHSAS